MAETAQGMVLPGLQLPEGVPVNFHLKQEAEFCFFTGSSRYGPINEVITSNTKLSNLKYEKAYRDYYDDIVKKETEWMTFLKCRVSSECARCRVHHVANTYFIHMSSHVLMS